MNTNINTNGYFLLFGAHISITGGLYKAFERGESIGCTAIQIFTKSNRQWKAKKLSPQEINDFESAFKKSTIKSVLAHASYLINIGSPNKEIYEKSINSLMEELERCEFLNIPYLILHPGSRQNSTEEECLNKIVNALNEVLEKIKGKTKILLENSSGAGTSVCRTFEQLASILEKIEQKNRIGICVDTCHLFAAGYDISTKQGYSKIWNEFEKILGFKFLQAIHINDSKKPCGSLIDRHEHISKGKIGEDFFRYLFNDERFFDIPKVLETPYETLHDYLVDMKVIKELISEKNKKLIKNL